VEVQLPLLVQYGAAVWKITAALVAFLGLVLVRAARARAARNRARAEVMRFLRGVSAPVLAQTRGPASISGTLRGGTVTTLLIGKHAHHDRGGDIWLDYKGERVEFAGAVRVVRGTFADAGREMPASTPRGIRDSIAREADGGSRVSRVLRRAAGGQNHRLDQVRDGDLVIAHGVLGERGGVDRFGVRSWILNPEPGSQELIVVAVAPAARAVPSRWYSSLLLAAVLATAASGGMYALGKRSLAQGRGDPATPELRAFDPLSLAAAAPGTRAAALDEIAKRYPALRARVDALPR
jgi:hypothetical protein